MATGFTLNKLDQYGFDWYNPPENVEIVSVMNLINDAMYYRQFQDNPETFRGKSLSIYRLFDQFIIIAENLINTHSYLHPDYINSTLNLTERRNRVEELFGSNLSSWVSLTILEWSDLEDITGEDLTVFKDRTLRTNEIFGVGLLTKMYKIIDAFKYRRFQSGAAVSHLIGEFLGQIAYTDNGTGDTDYTDNGISSNSLYNSYQNGEPSIIESSNSNAHDEFVNVFNQSKANKITLTTQLLSGQPYGMREERPANDFRATKQWLYRSYRRFSSGSSNPSYGYDYNDNQKDYYGCPISPQFSRGNSSNYYKSPTQVYSYRQEQDITDIDFYEAYCFYQKSDGFDFGTGLTLNDGGVLPFSKNQDNTMYTDIFANFSDSTSDFPLLNENTTYSLRMDSSTFFNLNDTEFNEYKTASANN